MIVLEYKLVATDKQKRGIDEAIRTAQFIRNACLRYWMDAKDSEKSVGKYDISKRTTQLRSECQLANNTQVSVAVLRVSVLPVTT